jgi:hypothetical protein
VGACVIGKVNYEVNIRGHKPDECEMFERCGQTGEDG